ncbi:TatD family hydrolase [Candidatus Peregrinibacteria bacterium]|nr:TatD family hydrolase [Candidatus Peregrinibacteria bacterium]
MANAKRAGVSKIINIGCDLVSCKKTIEMLTKDECLYSALGMHPYEAEAVNMALMSEWEKIVAENKRVVAVGECGLDYFKGRVSKDIQKHAFKMQIEFAVKVGLPLIVHNREADMDSLRILDAFGEGLNGVVFHCYGSNLEFAKELWKRGYLTSFTGIVTYPSALNVVAVVKEIPMNLFMVETDCSYLAPQKYRGSTNEPAYVVEVVKKIAEVKDLSFDEIANVSTENAMRFFGL